MATRASGAESAVRSARRTGLGAGAALLLAVAILAHLWIISAPLNPDATSALASAHALAARGTLETGSSIIARHPPVQALLLLPFAAMLGFGANAVHALELTAFLADLAALFLVSSRFAPRARIVPVFLAAFDPTLFQNMAEGRGLALLVLFATMLLWGILRGLSDSRYLMAASAGASLSFLTADTVGWLALLGATAGLAWRFYHRRWAILRDPWYWLAGAIFGATVVGWSVYNLRAIGSPYTDPRIPQYLSAFYLTTPWPTILTLTSGYAIYLGVVLLLPAFAFLALPSWRGAILRLPRRAVTDEHVGALVLFAGLAVLISALVAAALTYEEPLRSLAQADTYARYADVGLPAVALAIAGHIDGTAARRPVPTGAGAIAGSPPWVVPLALACILFVAQAPSVAQEIERPAGTLRSLSIALAAYHDTVVYSDVAPYLAYNLPGITFHEVDKGYGTPTVTVTAADVPPGAALVTTIYKPPVVDAQIDSFFLVRHFDPSNDSTMQNLFIR
ncbi:MAG: ArnT family glycosyltransferase [Thermoplasmatota archaeon]